MLLLCKRLCTHNSPGPACAHRRTTQHAVLYTPRCHCAVVIHAVAVQRFGDATIQSPGRTWQLSAWMDAQPAIFCQTSFGACTFTTTSGALKTVADTIIPSGDAACHATPTSNTCVKDELHIASSTARALCTSRIVTIKVDHIQTSIPWCVCALVACCRSSCSHRVSPGFHRRLIPAQSRSFWTPTSLSTALHSVGIESAQSSTTSMPAN